MAFWKYNIITQSHIDTLLDKPDVTLTEILAESDVLQEVRTHAPKLIKFICRADILDQLINLIIAEPDAGLDYRQQYKVANTACEVLTFDVPEINDALMNSPKLLARICGVFRREDALNDLTASFVCKLLILLATKRTEKMFDFVRYYDPDQVTRDASATAATEDTSVAPVQGAQAEEEKSTDTSAADNEGVEKIDSEKPVENGPSSDVPDSSATTESESAGEPMEQQAGEGSDEGISDAATKSAKEVAAEVDKINSSLSELQAVMTTSGALGNLEPNAGFVDLLLNHINNSAIKDLINGMVECSDNPELRPQSIEWLAAADLVPKLVALLSPENSEQVITNAAKCLCKIIKVGREQQMVLQDKCPPDPLLVAVEDTKTVSEILRHALPEKQSDVGPPESGDDDSVLQPSAWSLYESNYILLSLFQYKRTTPSFQDILLDAQSFLGVYAMPGGASGGSADSGSPTLGELDQQRAREAIGKCLSALIPRLGSLVRHLVSEPLPKSSGDEQEMSAPESSPVLFGSVRLEIIKLIAAVITAGDEVALTVLRDLHALPTILNLFFAYPLCSQLHNQVDMIVQAICNPPKSATAMPTESPGAVIEDSEKTEAEDSTAVSSTTKSTKHILFDQLFGECALLERIVENYKTVPKEQLGYNGHLRLMANYVEAMADNSTLSDNYTALMESLSPELKERWTAFKEKLQGINKHYAKTVEPLNATASCSEGDDPADLRDMGVPTPDAITSAQQAFNDYQMNQITASFFDQFGFHDDEFTDVDIPGMGKVASPPIEDHSSSDEEDEASGGTKNSSATGLGSAANCDPWNKIDEGFNPWNLAGASGGDAPSGAGASTSGTNGGQDDWADFGSFKTELFASGNNAGASQDAAAPSGTTPAAAQGNEEDNWADFNAFQSAASSSDRSESTAAQTGAQSTTPATTGASNSSAAVAEAVASDDDDEF